jgi:crotonobetainyl-CoA:carnitine CoA-transferase CaiB-like acyl-CoA transferase
VHPRLGEIPVVGTPVKFSRMKAGVRRSAPLLGEHTDEILGEAGYAKAEIEKLRRDAVV